MIISEKQIIRLIAIAHAHVANMNLLGEHKSLEKIREFLTEIYDQQSEELRVVE